MSWYDYEGPCCEGCDRIDSTEANEIEEEAIDRFRDYLHKQFSEEFDSLRKRREAVDELEKANKEKQNILEAQEKELERRKENFDKQLQKETEQIQTKIRQEFQNKFFDTFVPGTKVWFYEVKEIQETCPLCNGSGKIKQNFIDSCGKEFSMSINCPLCQYGKVVTSYKYELHEGEIISSRIIIDSTKIDLSIRSSMYKDGLSCVHIEYYQDNISFIKDFYYDFDKYIFFNKEDCEKQAKKAVLDFQINLKNIQEKKYKNV